MTLIYVLIWYVSGLLTMSYLFYKIGDDITLFDIITIAILGISGILSTMLILSIEIYLYSKNITVFRRKKID